MSADQIKRTPRDRENFNLPEPLLALQYCTAQGSEATQTDRDGDVIDFMEANHRAIATTISS